MQESVPLSMPLAVRSRPPLWLRLLPLWLVLLLAVGTVWWWVDSGRVESARAELDGMVLSVAPSYSARVLEVSVRPGQEVRQGALLARLDAADYNRRLGQAAREADDLRRMAGPPAGKKPPHACGTPKRRKRIWCAVWPRRGMKRICDSDSGRKAWLPTCAPSSICADWTVRAARVWWGRTSMPQPAVRSRNPRRHGPGHCRF